MTHHHYNTHLSSVFYYTESSENQSTVRGDDDYDDEYAEYEETETEDGTKATHRTSDEDF